MCELCGRNPCRSGCPNEPEPEYICDECGYGIEYGQNIYRLGGCIFCEKCVEDAAEYYEDPEDKYAPDEDRAYDEWAVSQLFGGD